jgi:hypothetical protein
MCSDGTQKKIDPAKGKSCLPWPGPLQRIRNLDSGAACARQVCSECDHEQHQENEKQELRYPRCGQRYASEAKDRSDERNQQEH